MVEHSHSTILDKAIGLLKEHYIIILVIIFLIASHQYIVRDYKALPAPLYGGDYYFQLGATNHVKYGGNALDSSSINGSLPAYFVTYGFLAGNIAKILGISAFRAEIVLSYLILIAGLIITYLLIHKIFKNRYLAVACAIAYHIPITLMFKYTFIGHQLLVPALLLALYNFFEKETYLNAAVIGVIYGICGLTHSVLFIASTMFLGMIFLYYFITRNRHRFTEKRYKDMTLDLSKYALIIFIGVAIAMLWWFKPIFIHHVGENAKMYMEINQVDYGKFSEQFLAVKEMFSQALINFQSPKNIINSIFVIAGVIFLFITKDSPEKRFISVLFVSAIIANLHFLLTYNLFSFQFATQYIPYLIVSPVALLVFAFGINTSVHLIRDKKYVSIILIALIVLLVGASLYSTKKADGDYWKSSATNGLPEYLIGLEKYLAENTDVYDTILSTNEVSFAVNGVSGRKVMVTRRAQSDPFMDMDRRQIDAAIILYGNDTVKRLELLKQYDIKYLYWDYYWIQSEFQSDNTGKIVGTFDPLLVLRSYPYSGDWDRYGVKYVAQNTWVDPSLRSDRVKKFDVLIISPENYNNFTNPWKPDLNRYIEEVWSYSQSGQKIAVLYKVSI